jgi:hypothetical protein
MTFGERYASASLLGIRPTSLSVAKMRSQESSRRTTPTNISMRSATR